MYSLIHLVQVATVLIWACQALDGFGYELIAARLECLEEKLHTIRNETRRLEERQRQTSEQISKLIQIMSRISLPDTPQVGLETTKPTGLTTWSVRSTTTTTGPTNKPQHYGSCTDVRESGRYMLHVSNKTFEVYCEKELYDGGGWIVIQNRFDGSVDFYRNWTEYQNGFGNLDGEFWLGLDKIHWLTSSRNYELRIILEDVNGRTAYARYLHFGIGGEDEKYILKTLDSYSGTAGDSFENSKGQKFSTYDQDNDSYANVNCAKANHGGWWYRHCTFSNLNGNYHSTYNDEAMWWRLFRDHQGLKKTKMMIRER